MNGSGGRRIRANSRFAALADNYKLLADVIDLKDSEKFRKGEITEFRTDDTEIVVNNEQEYA